MAKKYYILKIGWDAKNGEFIPINEAKKKTKHNYDEDNKNPDKEKIACASDLSSQKFINVTWRHDTPLTFLFTFIYFIEFLIVARLWLHPYKFVAKHDYL